MSRPSRSSVSRGHRRADPSRPSGAPLALLRGEWRTTIDIGILAALLILCGLGGGSAFTDTLSLLYVRPAAASALVMFLLTPARVDWRIVRAPALMLAVLALIMVVQLIPLPPAMWLSLPGRAPYAEAANAAGIAQPWRPLSLTPDLTLNSLVALVVPAAVLLGFAKITDDQRRWLVFALVILASASAALGVAQFASGRESPLYLYKRTHDGFPVGLLANRNHQAVLLALIFPALRVWTSQPAANRAAVQRRHSLALVLSAFVVLVILATGSRAGILVGAASIAAALALPAPRSDEAPTARARLLRLGVPLLMLLVVALSYWLGRAVSFERFSSLSTSEDQRFESAPVVIRIIKASFPVGTGFGSFDPSVETIGRHYGGRSAASTLDRSGSGNRHFPRLGEIYHWSTGRPLSRGSSSTSYAIRCAQPSGAGPVALQCDLIDPTAVAQPVKATPFDRVIHLAAGDPWAWPTGKQRAGLWSGRARLVGQNASTRPANPYANSKLAMKGSAALWRDRLSTPASAGSRTISSPIVNHWRRRAPAIELGATWVRRDFGDVRSVRRPMPGWRPPTTCRRWSPSRPAAFRQSATFPSR